MIDEVNESPKLPHIKRLVVRKKKELKADRNFVYITFLDHSDSKHVRRMVYTIAKKYAKDPSEGAPIPGSLEEDLVSPDTFFEMRHNSETASSTLPLIDPLRVSSPWKQLNPVDIFARAEVEQKRRTHLQFADDGLYDSQPTQLKAKKSFKSLETSTNKDASRTYKPKKNVKRVEATDEEIMIRFNEIGSKMNQHSLSNCTGFKSVKSMQTFNETKQERFFETHNNLQKLWSSNLQKTCAEAGRKPTESVVVRSVGYREKIEKAHAMEMTNPSAIIYGAQGWYLSLRSSPKFKDTRHYALPVGGSYNGLWMQITDNPHKQAEIIRSPTSMQTIKPKSYKDNPFLIAKQKQESKRLSELIPVNDNEDLEGLMVFL